MRIPTRKEFEDAFPTVVRYTGVIFAFALLGATILGYGADLAAGWIMAGGMIAYKTVHAAANGTKKSDDG